jgi:hypothetical protein
VNDTKSALETGKVGLDDAEKGTLLTRLLQSNLSDDDIIGESMAHMYGIVRQSVQDTMLTQHTESREPILRRLP